MAKKLAKDSSMNKIDLEYAYAFAKNAAMDAGQLMINARSTHEVKKKSEVNLVTETDIAINQMLCETLATVHDDFDIVAEEGVPQHLKRTSARYAWIVDPIDGTTNFVHGMQHSAVSIALFDREQEKSVLGIVHNPFRDECFTAFCGRGAFLNNKMIRVSSTKAVNDALVCTGFAYDRNSNPDNNLAEFTAMLAFAQDLRRIGAASLDLAYVAAGRFDGYFERGLQIWDMAAGLLLVTEAGGMISQYDGTSVNEKSRHVLASNGILHPALTQIIRQARQDANLPANP